MADIARRFPGAFPAWTRRRLLAWGLAAAALAYFIGLCLHFDLTPGTLWDGLTRGDKGVMVILGQMVPPWPFTASDADPERLAVSVLLDQAGLRIDALFTGAEVAFNEDWTVLEECSVALLETLAMAFLGTFLAGLFALVLGFLGAGNIVGSWLLRFSLRRLFDTLRGIDQLIWALVFVRMVGLGPMAGVLAIFVSDTGTLSKLFAEAIENAERKQMEGVRATGATNLLVMRFGALPQVLPVFVSQVLYYIESNTRSATVLGIVGAGGIGLQLSERFKILKWDQVGFIILLILLAVFLIDTLSRLLRQRIVGRQRMV
ncbi:MAG: phosphonate ABC transporter, permease protein PhnE [Alphaproteobacteria bacterium]